MTYIVINTTNMFDSANQTTFATEAEAEAKVREILLAFPQSVVRTAQLLKSYSATVSITSSDVTDAGSAASEE